MSRVPSRSLGVSIAALTIVRLLGLASGFAVGVIGARLLDPDALGAAGIAVTIGTLAGLLSNGGVNIGTILMLGRHPTRRGAVLQTGSVVALVGSGTAAVVAVAVGASIGPAIQLPNRLDLWVVTAAVGVGIVGYEFGGSVLLGLGRNRAYTVTELVRPLSTLAATCILLVAWPYDWAFVLAAGVGYLIAATWSQLANEISASTMRPRWHADLVGGILQPGLRGQAGNIVQFLNLRLDLLLIPIFIDLAAAGLYVVAVRLSEVITQAANAAGSLIFPAVAGGSQSSTELTERTARLSLVGVLFAAALLAILAEPIIAVAFGQQYAGSLGAVRVLSVAMVPLSLTRVLSADLKGRGRPGLVSIAMVGTLVITVALDLLLIPRLGIEGAAIASLVAYTASAVMLLIAFRSITSARLRLLIPGRRDVLTLARLFRIRG
ncbi:MAG: lipopolysaccharide biosynthesis protein [Candidatus Limnocylindria bacterium]